MRKLIVAASLVAVSAAVASPYQGSAQNAAKNDAAQSFDRAKQDCAGKNLKWNQNSIKEVSVKCERTRVLYRTQPVVMELEIKVPAETEYMKVSAKSDKYDVKGLEIPTYETGSRSVDGERLCAMITEVKETFVTPFMKISCADIADYESLEDVCTSDLAQAQYDAAKSAQNTQVVKEEVMDSWQECGTLKSSPVQGK